MLLSGAFDWILLVIEVMECWVVISDKVIFFLFGIYKIVDQPGWQNLSRCLFCHKIGEPVDKSFIFTILECRWCSLLLLLAQCPKKFLRFWFRRWLSFSHSSFKFWIKQQIRSRLLNKSLRTVFDHCFDYFLVVCEFHENVEFSIAPRWLEIDQVIEMSPRRFFI